MKYARCLSVLAALQVTATAQGLAQDSIRVSAPAASRSKTCWRGKPIPECNQFLITELGFYGRLLRPATRIQYPLNPMPITKPGSAWLFSIEVGAMHNVGTRSALGGTLVLGTTRDGGIKGAKARYRQWLTPTGTAIDLGAGFESRYDADFRTRGTQMGFTSDIAINVRDYASLVLRYDELVINGKKRPELSLGVRAGSRPALIVAGGIVATYMALAPFFLSF